MRAEPKILCLIEPVSSDHRNTTTNIAVAAKRTPPIGLDYRRKGATMMTRIAQSKDEWSSSEREGLRPLCLPCPLHLVDQLEAVRADRLDFGRFLLRVAKALERDHAMPSARLMISIDNVAMAATIRTRLASVAALMISGSLRRLADERRPELLIMLKERGGEVQLSLIDNSGRCLCDQEAAMIRRMIMPLGGVHDCEQSGSLVESSFSFLRLGVGGCRAS